ncbi:hypothetical protein Ciccas_004656 [Cichlidogyrus casuarinus]|uniref:AAA ATPase AAA+ lid domain-containing protein n=1 Tax=Cichlidogyrus casuarinus TaxID=1844966 RepID=A0ABD2QAV9_9PLAT
MFNCNVFVPKPDLAQRAHILKIHLKKVSLHESFTDELLMDIAGRTDGLSGSDLKEICREAAAQRFKIAMNFDKDTSVVTNLEGIDLKLRVEDFYNSIEKFRSTQLAAVTRPFA